jgi:hypothetical protein
MKKIISIILIITLAAALFACGKKTNNETVSDPETQIETDIVDKIDEELENNTQADDDKSDTADKPESKPADKKPAASTGSTASKPAAKPENKPAENTQKPEAKPETTPEVKPESTPATLGNTLLADFKAKAEGKNTQQIADALLANPAIKFSGGAAPVEEGLLSGFGNTEITGFKSGTMFAPMIGSIPFVGYIFELENSADVPAFISKLKNNADLRWNICVEADEMVTGSVGSKVFFVMCPTTLED